jgi:hypothetical protein
MKKIEIVLVGTISCSGTEKTEKLINEIITEKKLRDKVEFKKVIYTGIEKDFKYPIYGSPTVLINGKDLIFGDNPPPLTFA